MAAFFAVRVSVYSYINGQPAWGLSKRRPKARASEDPIWPNLTTQQRPHLRVYPPSEYVDIWHVPDVRRVCQYDRAQGVTNQAGSRPTMVEAPTLSVQSRETLDTPLLRSSDHRHDAVEQPKLTEPNHPAYVRRPAESAGESARKTRPAEESPGRPHPGITHIGTKVIVACVITCLCKRTDRHGDVHMLSGAQRCASSRRLCD